MASEIDDQVRILVADRTNGAVGSLIIPLSKVK